MKPATSIKQQIEILKSRGLIIENESSAEYFLSQVSYYRFTGYTKLFLKAPDSFDDGVKFENIKNIYYFDCKLRNLLNEIMADIEITVRTQIAYNLANSVSPICYADSSNFENIGSYEKTIKEINEERKRKTRDPMIEHFKDEEFLPIWVAVEIASFGTLSKMFENLKADLRKSISDNSIFKIKHNLFESYLAIATILRNRIAHRERLYGKYFNKAPLLTFEEQKYLSENGIINKGSQTTLFIYLYAIRNLLVNKQRWEYFLDSLEKLISNTDEIKLNNIGFPANWRSMLEQNKI